MHTEPMSLEHERDLAIRAQAGDREAMNDLIVQWTPLVKSRVKHWFTKAPYWVSADDLLSAGLDGLWVGIRKWRAGGSARLGSYATHWVDQRIRRAMNQRLIHIPDNEIGKDRDLTDRVFFFDYLDIYWNVGGADIESLDPAEQAIRNLTLAEMRKTINRVAGCMLTRHQANILKMYAIDQISSRDIAERLGISRSRVTCVIREAKEVMRDSPALRRLLE